MTLYDVCNDYSLDPAEDQTLPRPSVYKSRQKYGGVAYYHKEYRELHYYLGDDGLQGRNIQAVGLEEPK